MRATSKLAPGLGTAISVAVLAGCVGAGSGTPPAPPPETPNITIDVVPTADAAGLYIAYDHGYFWARCSHRTETS
jgi:ABC-type nitrate/sulfonate/bicarbonate transport system substrate-binding protein